MGLKIQFKSKKKKIIFDKKIKVWDYATLF